MFLQSHTPAMKIAPPHVDIAALLGHIAIFWIVVIGLTAFAISRIPQREPVKEEADLDETAST